MYFIFFLFLKNKKSANFFLGFGGIAKRLSHTKKKVRTYARNFTQLLLWLFFFWRFSECHKQSVNTKLCLNKIISSFPFFYTAKIIIISIQCQKNENLRAGADFPFISRNLSATPPVPISLVPPVRVLFCWRGRVGKHLKYRK